MLLLNSIVFDDFYFNGHLLSEYSGVIAGKEGLPPFSVLPEKEIKTERVIGQDETLVYDVTYSPRVFTVPVYFTDLTKIRDISLWLSAKQPQDFYFKNDTVKIKAMLDSVIDISGYLYSGGVCELKFIAHNPFYYKITETAVVFTSPSGTKTLTNEGNIESYPLIKITSTGTSTTAVNCTLILNGNTIVISNLKTAPVYIDMQYCTVYTDSGTKVNFLPNYNGSFFPINAGSNSFSITNCSKIEFTCRSRWI